jgi:anti-anti-sigma factor
VVLAAVGEIDALSAPEFAVAVHDLTGTSSELAIDFSAVTFMDSSGLSVLAAAVNDRGLGSPIHVRGASAMVRRLLAMSGIDTLLTVEPEDAGPQPDAA